MLVKLNTQKSLLFKDNNKNIVKNQSYYIDNEYSNMSYSNMYMSLPNQARNINPKSISMLENYDFAKRFFEKNINQEKPVLGSTENISSMLSNDKIRRNLCKYFAERADKELSQIENSKIKTHKQIEKIEGLTQVSKFFNEFLEVWPENENICIKNQPLIKFHSGTNLVAFAGAMKYDDENHCKNVVHGIAGTCGLISGSMAELAATGADAPILRTVQSMMFLYMQQYLKVPFVPSAEYTFKEMCSGAVLGTEGARVITSWLGVGAHAASIGSGTSAVSVGTSDAAISGGVGAVNGSLSFLITEKMGRGYVRRVKNNQMTFKYQTVETLGYFAGRGLLAGNFFNEALTPSVVEACDPHSIKDAIDAIPKETKSILGEFMNIIVNLHVPDKLATFFVLNVAQNIILSKDRSKEGLKKVAADSFRQAFINTVVYDICDLATDQTITKNATDTIEDMKKNLESYPDVYKKFVDAEHEFFEKINIDTLDSHEFTIQFKNKTFVYNLSKWSDAQIKEFSELWRNRKRKNQAATQLGVISGLNTQMRKKEKNSTIINSADNTQIKKEIEEMQAVLHTQQNLLSSKDNFGYGRIAGYEKNKIIIAQKFISPVGLEKSKKNADIPDAILFFGPTNTGKSTMAKCIAEQAKCRLIKFPTFIQEEQVMDKLHKLGENSEETFNEGDSRKRTIILIDEFDGLCKNPKLAKDLEKFINDCSKKYHCTLFLTTNNPETIPSGILAKMFKLPMGPSTQHDLKEVLIHYLKNKVETTFNCDLIATELVKHYPNKMYSNAQVEDLCDLCYQSKNGPFINQNEMINLINKTEPEITNEDIIKFENEKLKLKESGNKYEQN